MLRHRSIDRICAAALAASLILTMGFMGLAASGTVQAETSIGYENRLFDTSRVHTLDIVMDDWEGFIETCTNEEYAACTVVVDGENYGNVAIRAKGNTSLSNVASFGNDRYSFKIEFDHYESGKTYHGLDKLSLNNIIQDKTYMKDYLAYTLMGKMGVAAPLCSYVQINVNGNPWGLYLAVEGVEDSFLKRNYGSDYGDLYKPDSLSFGGGRGNGKGFDMEDFRERFEQQEEGAALPDFPAPEEMVTPEEGNMPSFQPPMNGGGPGGMGSDDVYLRYIDDDPESYANIFNSAKTDVTEADQQRLIAALKALGEGDASAVDADRVARYLAVHHFLCNDDSYTGQMVHNYYLYEENGRMQMIPWDYNLAFGAFSMGRSGSGATSIVNAPIDTPVSDGDVTSRPMVSWIFESEEYVQLYHAAYAELCSTYLQSGWLDQEIQRVSALITPYVQSESRPFFTYEEFTAAVNTLRDFCTLRTQSIAGQLDGSIPSTSEGQKQSADALVDASHVDLSAMGEFGMGGGPGSGGGMRGGRGGGQMQEMSGETSAIPAQPSMPEGFPPEMVEAADRQQSAMQPVILLAGSVALLLAALLFAWRYPFKR